MKIAVNLASHPYIELEPIYRRLRTWTLILALLGAALWYLYHNESDQAEAAKAQVAQVESHVRQLQQQEQSYQTLMRQPKEAAILEQSDFLNGLFQRKAFSWTATMTDLETVLPGGVQVLSIDPIVAPDGHVIIRLRVTGERDRALELVRNLEKSRHFAAPRLASESLATSQGQGASVQNISSTNNDVNFDILADYRPLPLDTGGGKKAKTASDATHARAAGSKTPKPAAGGTTGKAEGRPTP